MCKGENSREKYKISHFKALTRKLFYNKLQIKILKEAKAIIYYSIIVKNQVIQIEKQQKKTKKRLGITSIRLSHKDYFYEKNYIINKKHKIYIF